MPLTVLVAKSSIFYSHVFMIANGHLGDVRIVRYTSLDDIFLQAIND